MELLLQAKSFRPHRFQSYFQRRFARRSNHRQNSPPIRTWSALSLSASRSLPPSQLLSQAWSQSPFHSIRLSSKANFHSGTPTRTRFMLLQISLSLGKPSSILPLQKLHLRLFYWYFAFYSIGDRFNRVQRVFVLYCAYDPRKRERVVNGFLLHLLVI